MLRAFLQSGLAKLCLWDLLKDTELVVDHLVKDLTQFTQVVLLTHLDWLMIPMPLQN
ncbi:hypothetical protein CRYUN_Cryun23aG0045500 [Craigia yunnanensis]